MERADTEQARLQQLLDSTVGRGKAVVVVNATVNRSAVASAQQSYARAGTPLVSARDTYSGSVGSGRVVDAERAVGTKITLTHVASGATTRQSVALVVDSSIPPASVRALKTTVATAAGINRRRGDRLTVSRVRFAKPPAAAAAGLPAGINAGDIRYAGMVLAALIVVVFLVRALRRAEDKRLD